MTTDHDHPDTDLTDPHGEAAALRRENERLRAALQPIVDHDLFHDDEYLSRELVEKLNAARAALRKGGAA